MPCICTEIQMAVGLHGHLCPKQKAFATSASDMTVSRVTYMGMTPVTRTRVLLLRLRRVFRYRCNRNAGYPQHHLKASHLCFEQVDLHAT
jgi:hypothetical protein